MHRVFNAKDTHDMRILLDAAKKWAHYLHLSSPPGDPKQEESSQVLTSIERVSSWVIPKTVEVRSKTETWILEDYRTFLELVLQIEGTNLSKELHARISSKIRRIEKELEDVRTP